MDYTKILEFLRSAKGIAVYTLLNSWYWLVAGAALIITYNVLDGASGPLGDIYNNLKIILDDTIRLSLKCPSKVGNFQEFFRCFGT